MTRFFFHIHNSQDIPDLLGQELADLADARDVAIREARELAAHDVMLGKLELKDWIEVTDQHGAMFFSVEIGDAVSVVNASSMAEALKAVGMANSAARQCVR